MSAEARPCPKCGRPLIEVRVGDGVFRECYGGHKFNDKFEVEYVKPPEAPEAAGESPARLPEVAWATASRLMGKDRFLTMEDTGELMVYRDGVYVPGAESYVKARVEADAPAKGDVSTHLVNEVIEHIKRSTMRPRSVFDEGNNPHLVLQNCLLNLRTGKVEPFSPDYYALNKMPVAYDLTAGCPAWDRFLSEVLSPEDAVGVQEELGAMLRKRYLTKKLSIYLGETDTGKTTLIGVILALLGQENVSSVSIQALGSRDKFALAPLFGKMANIRDDLPKDVVQTVGRMKELTGGYQVQAERKYFEPFTFVNRAFFVFTCNTLPPIEEDDNAFFNRVIIRLFRNRFGGHAEPDRTLTDKLTTPGELSGILNWGLRGLARLEATGWNFTSTASLDATREDYKRRSSPVWAFVQDRLDADSSGAVTKERLYNEFKAYCEYRGIPLLSKDGYYKRLPQEVTVTTEYRTPEGETGRKHCFVGIRLRPLTDAEKAARAAQAARTAAQGVQGVQGSGHPGGAGQPTLEDLT